MTFLKHDAEKPRPALIPVGFVMEMGRVMAYGAKKYAVDNWQKCDDVRRYYDAALRHVLAVVDGEENDPESGLSHLAHAACSCAMAFGLLALQRIRWEAVAAAPLAAEAKP